MTTTTAAIAQHRNDGLNAWAFRPSNRAGLTPVYAVRVRPKENHAQQQATEVHLKDAQTLAREVLRALPEVVAVLPPDEVNAALNGLPILR